MEPLGSMRGRQSGFIIMSVLLGFEKGFRRAGEPTGPSAQQSRSTTHNPKTYLFAGVRLCFYASCSWQGVRVVPVTFLPSSPKGKLGLVQVGSCNPL